MKLWLRRRLERKEKGTISAHQHWEKWRGYFKIKCTRSLPPRYFWLLKGLLKKVPIHGKTNQLASQITPVFPSILLVSTNFGFHTAVVCHRHYSPTKVLFVHNPAGSHIPLRREKTVAKMGRMVGPHCGGRDCDPLIFSLCLIKVM